MPEIIEFKPVEQDKVIETIEQLLEQAKAGNVMSFGFAAVKKGGSIATAYSGLAPNVFTLLGAIDYLKFRVRNYGIQHSG